MGPLEILFATIFVMFVLIAIVRGYPRELGVTTLLFVALFLITQFAMPYFPRLLHQVNVRFGFAALTPRSEQHILSLSLTLLFIALVFASYAGETFVMRGRQTPGSRGTAVNLLIGALNGYLVAGTIWFFQDFYKYPLADFADSTGHAFFLQLPLTPLAETLARFLPLYVAPPLFWAFMVMLMLLIRVRK